MSNALMKYDSARAALAEVHRVDEVKTLRDKAQALAAYAKQAQDTKLLATATEIKVRAERKAGQLLIEMKRDGRRADKGRPEKTSHDVINSATLKDLGISLMQSSRWQKLAGMPEEMFEQCLTEAIEKFGEVTSAFVKRYEKEYADKDAKDKPEEKEDEMTGLLRTFIEAAMEAVEEAQSYEESGFRNSKPDAYRENMIEAIKAQRAIRDFFS